MSRPGDGKDKGLGGYGAKKMGRERRGHICWELQAEQVCRVPASLSPTRGKWSCRSALYITANDEKF